MEEYVSYLSVPTRIGTADILDRVSYGTFREQLTAGSLVRAPECLPPVSYTDPDYGFLFRFPFPDEDILEFGDLKDRELHRGLLVKIERDGYFPRGFFPELDGMPMTTVGTLQYTSTFPMENPNNADDHIYIELTYQTAMQVEGKRMLALVFRCPFSGKLFKVKDWLKANYLVMQIRKRYLDRCRDATHLLFWTEVITRIRNGYFQPDQPLNRVYVPYLF